MGSTPRLGIPFLSPGQAQKEFFHNEACRPSISLSRLQSRNRHGIAAKCPAVGACYIVASAPTGAWAGNAQYMVAFTSGGWRFFAPFEG